MFGNFYITIGVVAIIPFIYQLFNLQEVIGLVSDGFSISPVGGIAALVLMLIPIGMLTIVSIKGFYQKWDDLKKGKSR